MSRFERSISALLCLIAAIFLGIMMVLPPFTRIGEMDFVISQMLRCKTIVACLHAYAYDHDGKYPESLNELVASGLIQKKDLLIDLRDGKPPVTWLYRLGLSLSSPADEWVVASPPIANTVVSDRERKRRERAGGLQYPPKLPWRVAGRNDTVIERMPEEKFHKTLTRRPMQFSPTELPHDAGNH